MSKNTRLQNIYFHMKYRCTNPKNKSYHYYGDRGITVCDEWLNNSKAFYTWALKHGYRNDLTIDRIDNNGNYCPENCRWITQKEQSNNTRRNKYVTIDGQTHTIAEWCDITGINYGTLKSRVKRGLTQQFLSKKNLSNPNIKPQKIAQYTLDGKMIKIWDSLTQIHKEKGYDISTISRLCRHIIKNQCYTAYNSGWTYYPQEREWHNLKGKN